MARPTLNCSPPATPTSSVAIRKAPPSQLVLTTFHARRRRRLLRSLRLCLSTIRRTLLLRHIIQIRNTIATNRQLITIVFRPCQVKFAVQFNEICFIFNFKFNFSFKVMTKNQANRMDQAKLKTHSSIRVHLKNSPKWKLTKRKTTTQVQRLVCPHFQHLIRPCQRRLHRRLTYRPTLHIFSSSSIINNFIQQNRVKNEKTRPKTEQTIIQTAKTIQPQPPQTDTPAAS